MAVDGETPVAPGAWLAPVAPAPSPPADSNPFGDEKRPLHKRIGSAIVAGLLAVVKFGKVVLLALPKLKLLTTSGSMLVSVAAYSLIWGWKFAIGFVILLFIHEMGHVIALRREGIPASAPMFVPFLGAVISARSLGDDALAEARVGLAGPILGSIGAAACIPLASATGNDMFTALAFTGFFLNLFNLLPVVPLDGGRAMAAMSPRLWFLGFFAVVLLAFLRPNPILILIALLSGFEIYRRWKALRHGGEVAKAYYKVSPRNRALVAAVYIGLIVALAFGMHATHLARDFGDV